MGKLRAAVIGVGYLGRFHAHKYAGLDEVELVGVADVSLDRAREVAAEVRCRAENDYRKLLDEVDLVSIAVPTQEHFSVARACLEKGVHILVEKPVTQTVAEADELISLAEEAGLVFQVGHLERFNPAIMALEGVLTRPAFIESHRMASFKPRGTDVNVVLDLMIHDIDIILNLVRSPLVKVNSVGVPVLSGEVDIANARLQFANGCVANVTASRVSLEPMRKIRIFQPETYISIDYMARKIGIFKQGGQGMPLPAIPNVTLEEKCFTQGDSLLEEIKAFVRSVRSGEPPLVSGADGRRALEVATRISEKLTHQLDV